jgi:hypothetical protein
MMITAAELEDWIAKTPEGEQVQFETKSIGSVEHVTQKLNELKLSRSHDPHLSYFCWARSVRSMLPDSLLNHRRPG